MGQLRNGIKRVSLLYQNTLFPLKLRKLCSKAALHGPHQLPIPLPSPFLGPCWQPTSHEHTQRCHPRKDRTGTGNRSF